MEIEYRKSVIHQTVGGEDMETEVFLPDFGDGQEQRPIGIWGQRHLRYLKNYRKVLYTNLLTSGKLNIYLADIDNQAEEMFERLTKQMAASEDITEQMKAIDQTEWVRKMNNIRNRVTEIVNNDLIYAY